MASTRAIKMFRRRLRDRAIASTNYEVAMEAAAMAHGLPLRGDAISSFDVSAWLALGQTFPDQTEECLTYDYTNLYETPERKLSAPYHSSYHREMMRRENVDIVITAANEAQEKENPDEYLVNQLHKKRKHMTTPEPYQNKRQATASTFTHRGRNDETEDSIEYLPLKGTRSDIDESETTLSVLNWGDDSRVSVNKKNLYQVQSQENWPRQGELSQLSLLRADRRKEFKEEYRILLHARRNKIRESSSKKIPSPNSTGTRSGIAKQSSDELERKSKTQAEGNEGVNDKDTESTSGTHSNLGGRFRLKELAMKKNRKKSPLRFSQLSDEPPSPKLTFPSADGQMKRVRDEYDPNVSKEKKRRIDVLPSCSLGQGKPQSVGRRFETLLGTLLDFNREITADNIQKQRLREESKPLDQFFEVLRMMSIALLGQVDAEFDIEEKNSDATGPSSRFLGSSDWWEPDLSPSSSPSPSPRQSVHPTADCCKICDEARDRKTATVMGIAPPPLELFDSFKNKSDLRERCEKMWEQRRDSTRIPGLAYDDDATVSLDEVVSREEILRYQIWQSHKIPQNFFRERDAYLCAPKDKMWDGRCVAACINGLLNLRRAAQTRQENAASNDGVDSWSSNFTFSDFKIRSFRICKN